ncbi:MAG: 6-phosphogluconolactonase [Desulfobacteria bacterium]
MSNITIYPDREHFVDGSADFIAELAVRAVAERGRFAIALSGGGTPRPIYARLATAGYIDRIEWTKVHIFFSDERCVPPDDSRSNYRMAREALLDHVPLPPGNIHRVRGEDDPAQAALAYAQEVQRLFRTASAPAFDLICLGIGDNGHTASLFPGTAALCEQVRWVVPQYVEVMTTWRVTFTPVLINAARHVAFLAEGVGKADMLWRVHEGPYQPDVLPSQLIQPVNGRLHWLVDAAAGSKVQSV